MNGWLGLYGRSLLLVMLALQSCPTVSRGETVLKEPSAVVVERRATAFLSRAVGTWHAKNRCYSCHNNGDGVRVLLWSGRFGLRTDASVLRDSIRWLSTPERWKQNAAQEEFNDHKLATIQFALALDQAVGRGLVRDQTVLRKAEQLIVDLQNDDGSWTEEVDGDRGSPTTYGRFLATALLCNMLSREPDRYQTTLNKAKVWFARTIPKSTVAAAAVMLVRPRIQPQPAVVARCRMILITNQAPDGGWGPDANSPSEPFDTAVALLALRGGSPANSRRQIRLGRTYLLQTQLADGAWPETTRPALRESYAQRVSTTAWALQSLIATRPAPMSK